MEIKVKKNNFQMYSITFGRDLPHCKCLYLISVTLEDYNDKMEMVYASFIKGWFRKKKCS